MVNIFTSTNLATDLKAFETALFQTNDFKHSLDDTVRPFFKKAHRHIYVIALIQHKVEIENKSYQNRYLFLAEIVSDLLSNLSLSFMGFYHSSEILTRRIIENFYNHIYYYDHPVEYELLNLGRNDYTPISTLKEYLEKHPFIKFVEDKNIKDFNERLLTAYQELCKIVHTKGESFMGLAKNLEEIKPDFDLRTHFENLNRITLSIIYLLFKFHLEIKFSNVEISLVSRTFPSNLRAALLS